MTSPSEYSGRSASSDLVEGWRVGTLLDGLPDAAAILNPQTEVVVANSAWTQRWPVSRWWMDDIMASVVPEDAGTVQACLGPDRLTGRSLEFIFRVEDPPGSVKYFEWRSSRMADEHTFVLLREVTSGEALRHAAADMNEALVDATQLAGVGGWRHELASNQFHWDEVTRRIHEVDQETSVDLDLAVQFYAPEAREVFRMAVEDATLSRIPWDLELPFVTARGRRIWVRSVGRPVERDGKVVALTGVLQDISSHKEQERGLLEARLEAENASRAKSQFLANMSHEIRTPMAGVLGMLDLILDSPLDPEAKERAVMARASANGLMQILNDILDYSKIEAKEMRIERIEFEPRNWAKEAVSLLEGRAAEKEVRIRLWVDSEVPRWVMGDPYRLRQVLLNLVGNAVKFTHRGSVDVGVGHDGTWLRVQVRDTGIGMTREVQEAVFSRFAQADPSTTRKFGGTGLGLAICKELVQLMDGSIEVTSELGKGSCFTFRVPAEATPGEATASTDCQPVRAAVGLKVLVAEDNPVNRMVIRGALQKMGHRPHLVEDGQAAVQAVTEEHFDVVLMDVQMPVMDGIGATEAIRRLDSPARDVPIVALTANAMPGDRERFLAAGMDEYASKPVVRDDLAQAMTAAMERRAV